MVDLLDQLYLDQADGLPGSTYYRNRVDCKDILGDNRAASSGIYEIKTWKSKSKIKVLCDMETSGGGWTVFHNRFDGSVDFYRNFTDYENGFGDIAGEFWLGFKYMQEMVKAGQSQLLLQVTAKDRSTGHELAGDFSLRSENLYYEDQILFSLGIATRYRCLLGLSGAAFTTMDRDVEINCAEQMRSPWWYRNCGDEICNLHGKYGENGPAGYYHQGIAGYYEPLKASRMMFRRKHGYF
ncbi:ficolin-1-A-like [Mercenaria mercenaria]|uniref:ficolin-1-A-like n=1 Tax=Mercenaria mercenaria TaxID=6596 RepID=UPI00234F9EEC|nr:ficolin-1-A-like [Mercenaria mercenaria]